MNNIATSLMGGSTLTFIIIGVVVVLVIVLLLIIMKKNNKKKNNNVEQSQQDLNANNPVNETVENVNNETSPMFNQDINTQINPIQTQNAMDNNLNNGVSQVQETQLEETVVPTTNPEPQNVPVEPTPVIIPQPENNVVNPLPMETQPVNNMQPVNPEQPLNVIPGIAPTSEPTVIPQNPDNNQNTSTM